ncbi:MAG TPA: 2-C-methyl-D-erythritol 4-phosphate cytidylyltransferase [Bacteroidia bacterium]|jgi:2-C-methyl-D-erythritol 4-phosphate cytidylyltransferase|nr:2-C-methyl-D-erythritol 4-phosphate cytidylyltransferase [Bacteroidia bacterium]
MTESTNKKYAIIVAGGNGVRANTPVPKQFMKLDGKPVIMHAINKFSEAGLNIEIIVVLNKDQINYWHELCKENNFNTEVKIAEGGENRFESVKNGLALITEEGIVAVHDSVRPLVSAKTIITAFKAAEMYGNAVPAIPLTDSIRQIDSSKSIAVDRTRYCIIQTPQCFQTGILKKAYSTSEYKIHFTDDASVVEASGEKIHLVDGNPDNIKITSPRDFILAEALIKYRPVVTSGNKLKPSDELNLLGGQSQVA